MTPRVPSLLLLASFLGACTDGDPPTSAPIALTRPQPDRTYVRDEHGRYLLFHGVNVSGDTKAEPPLDAAGVPTFVGKPFAVAAAPEHLAKLRRLGFNAMRLLVVWEGIEPVARGQYDQEYLKSIREIVRLAGEHGIYVLLDMHQDMFSRHLRVRYNERPKFGAPGSVENTVLALVGPYTDMVMGDGAPRWVVEACLPEKKLDAPSWGTPRLLGGIQGKDIAAILKLYQKLTGTENGPPPNLEWLNYFFSNLPPKFAVDESTDMLPFTNWPLTQVLSLDLARSYACLYAGDKVFPGRQVEGVSVKDYLQDAYAAAWGKVAEQVADLPNVMGYDIMNEPSGNFLVLSAAAGLVKAGVVEGALSVLQGLLGEETGLELYTVLTGLRLLPPDANKETLQRWGLNGIDLMGVLGLNNGFDEDHLRPFYERAARAIQRHDRRASIYVEPTRNISTEFLGGSGGIAGQWEVPMTRLRGLDPDWQVLAPHWYPDIYPFPGFNQPPRSFAVEEIRHRDYQLQLEKYAEPARHSLGNSPVVYGEFGTYFNFGGIESAASSGYLVSAHILDNYYETFERLFQSRFIWCYSGKNSYDYGDGWNKEDFSIVDPAGQPRAALAWSRPYPRALAGKPIATHFYSDLHYYDPDKGEQLPRREFEVRYASKETSAPTEIFVPPLQYPEGFYVWLSDGFAHYDPQTFILYHYPAADEPGVEHWVRLRLPLPNQVNEGWHYFFRGNRTLSGR